MTVLAGALAAPGLQPAPAPPPDSWAALPQNDVAIATLQMAPGAQWTLPPARDAAVRRCLYFFSGATLQIDGEAITQHAAIELRADQAVQLHNGEAAADLLLLQGRPIGEPVAQHGPFVMNTRDEVLQAFADYQRTQFGGWPWPDSAPVHGADGVRFARHADGRLEQPAG